MKRLLPVLLPVVLIAVTGGCKSPAPLTYAVAPSQVGQLLWSEEFNGAAGTQPNRLR
jgi:hypothetical protein